MDQIAISYMAFSPAHSKMEAVPILYIPFSYVIYFKTGINNSLHTYILGCFFIFVICYIIQALQLELQPNTAQDILTVQL